MELSVGAMATAANIENRLLNLPAELRNRIYAFACPCVNAIEPYCNPILSRRLGRPRSFICYKCPGEVLLSTCEQMRAEILSIVFGAHDFRFQLWKEHKTALEAWFNVVSEEAVSHIRRFRLHTQYPDESLDLSRTPGTGSAMPGYIAVDLDASNEVDVAVTSLGWTQLLLEQPRKQVLEVLRQLPRANGRSVLTKEALLEIVSFVGWFGTRDERERLMIAQQGEARRLLR